MSSLHKIDICALGMFAFCIGMFLAQYHQGLQLPARMNSASVLLARDVASESPAPIRILLVPGHDSENPGASYRTVIEEQLNLQMASELYTLLASDNRFEVFLTRDHDGYTPEFLAYMDAHRHDIANFITTKKAEMAARVQRGTITRVKTVHRNTARPEVVETLYGINKYIADTDIDMVLHIHFNDYPHKKNTPGIYSGLAIYVPEQQLQNAKHSRKLAEAILPHLMAVVPVSNNPNEEAGIVEDQQLIALGAHNTLDIPSVLIEYGYIYEDRFMDMDNDVFMTLAEQTYRGVVDYVASQ